MKYCKHCGKPIEENGVCDCEKAVAERQSAGSGASNVADTPYVAMPHSERPKQDSKFVDSLKNIPVILTSYMKNPKKTVGIAKKTDDIIAGGLFAAIMFLALLLSNCCYFGRIAAVSRGYIGFNFGVALLSAFLTTLFAAGGYVLIAFVLRMAFKKADNGMKAFTDSVISFGVNSIVPAAAVILGGLFMLFASYIGLFFFCVAVFWYVICALRELDSAPGEPKNLFVYMIVKAAAPAFAVIAVLLIFVWMNALGLSSAVSSMFGIL